MSMNQTTEGSDIIWRSGPWSPHEDEVLLAYVKEFGPNLWNEVHKKTGLLRNGKSCRLRWCNNFRPGLKKDPLTPQEMRKIVELHGEYGNKWSIIASQLPGRTDNEIKNFWNTTQKRLKRRSEQATSYCQSSSSQPRLSRVDAHSNQNQMQGNNSKRPSNCVQNNSQVSDVNSYKRRQTTFSTFLGSIEPTLNSTGFLSSKSENNISTRNQNLSSPLDDDALLELDMYNYLIREPPKFFDEDVKELENTTLRMASECVIRDNRGLLGDIVKEGWARSENPYNADESSGSATNVDSSATPTPSEDGG